MLISTIILGILAVILLYIGYKRGNGEHIEGLKSALNLTIDILPLLIFAFLIAGMAQVLLSHELVTKWLGPEAGMRGILIGTVAGALTPGGPFVSLPIAAGLIRAGAGVGTMIAFLTSWSLAAFSRFPLELGILGWKLTIIRFACTFFFAPIAGYIANFFFSGVKLN